MRLGRGSVDEQTWSMRTPNLRRPVPVFPEYVMPETVAPVADFFVLMRSAWSLQGGKTVENVRVSTHVELASNALVRDSVVLDGDARDGHVRTNGTLCESNKDQGAQSDLGMRGGADSLWRFRDPLCSCSAGTQCCFPC